MITNALSVRVALIKPQSSLHSILHCLISQFDVFGAPFSHKIDRCRSYTNTAVSWLKQNSMHGPMFPFLFHILIHFSINHTEKKPLSDGTVNVGTVVNISIHFEIAYNYKRRVYNIYVHYKKKTLKDSILEHTCKEKKTPLGIEIFNVWLSI